MGRNSGFIATDIPGYLTNYTRSQIDVALAAFEDLFDTVKVSMNARRDKSGWVTCQIKVRLVPSGIWIIQESRDTTPYAAIANAAGAIARSLSRQLARLKHLQPLTTAA